MTEYLLRLLLAFFIDLDVISRSIKAHAHTQKLGPYQATLTSRLVNITFNLSPSHVYDI